MVVQVERVKNRIWVRSPFKYKDRIKGQIGARWSKDNKVWTLPLDMETCRRLRDEFGNELVIGEQLWKWASEQNVRERSINGLVDANDIDVMAAVELPVVMERCPGMWQAMMDRPYQPVASLYMAKVKRCINADQPGIGKTIETLGALIEQGTTGRILVLAPKTSCLTVWPYEIDKWLDTYDGIYSVTQMAGLGPKDREAAMQRYEAEVKTHPNGMHFLVVNAEQVGIKKFTVCPAGICDGDEDWCPEYANHRNKSEKRRPFLHAVEWDAIIADETHKWLINTRGKSASQVGYGFTKLRVTSDTAPMYALTGTPLKGKKYNLFGTLNWMWPQTYTSKWRWIETWWVVNKVLIDAGRRGMIETKEITQDWLSNKAEQAFYRSLRTVMIRRTKDELRAINPGWMPPAKTYHDIWVPMEGSQRTHYRMMESLAEVSLQGGRLTATGVLAEMTRLKQFANSDGEMVKGEFQATLPSAKFNWLLQFLEERGIEPGGDLSDDVHKVVIASQFTSLINLWANALEQKGIENYRLTGEVSDKKRNQIVRAFQKHDDVRVFLINTKAGGVSITLDSADDMVIMDETWVPDDQEQVEDRVHRASNVTHSVDVWYVRTEDTIEEGIALINRDKAETNHIVLDAQRGLKFAAERFGAKIKETD